MFFKDKVFLKLPNKYIRCNIQKDFGVSKKFYIIYLLIGRYRSLEGVSWLTIKKVFEFYGYKRVYKKSEKQFKDVIRTLEFMQSNNLIRIHQDLDLVSYDTGIEITLLPDFTPSKNYTAISTDDLDMISQSPELNKENILLVFLYVSSYIGNQPGQMSFWRKVDNIVQDLSISKRSVLQCLDFLVGQKLLIKEEVKTVTANREQKLPNIYVLNREGYEQEIESAKSSMKRFFQVDESEK